VGLFDKIKNKLTGDWADVTVDVASAARGGTMQATATVAVKEQAISIEGIVVELQCVEQIDIPNAHVHSSFGSTSNSGTGRATSSEALFDVEVKAAPAQELAAGATLTAAATIDIPSTAPPTFQGRYARYEWQVRARVEMGGNDPDSGWQSLHLA
jgi:hypothetical protein